MDVLESRLANRLSLEGTLKRSLMFFAEICSGVSGRSRPSRTAARQDDLSRLKRRRGRTTPRWPAPFGDAPNCLSEALATSGPGPKHAESEPWRSRRKRLALARPRFGRDVFNVRGWQRRGSHGMPIASRIAWNVCRFVGSDSAKNIVWLRAFWAISGSSIFGCSVIGKPRTSCAVQ